MTNIEHLIESAIFTLEVKETYEKWSNRWITSQNLQGCAAKPQEIWEIANWVYYVYKPYIESEKEEELVKDYGYELKGD